VARWKTASTLFFMTFTIAHELGQYLLHRKKYPNGIQSSESDVDERDEGLGRAGSKRVRILALDAFGRFQEAGIAARRT
jgi:hypothetical protein